MGTQLLWRGGQNECLGICCSCCMFLAHRSFPAENNSFHPCTGLLCFLHVYLLLIFWYLGSDHRRHYRGGFLHLSFLQSHRIFRKIHYSNKKKKMIEAEHPIRYCVPSESLGGTS